MTDKQHIESFMRTRTRTLMSTDWYQAGHSTGTAPTEWEMTEYGRDTALGWYTYGNRSMDESISLGFRAMYDYAYNDVRDTIARTAGSRRTMAATSETEIHTVSLVYNSEKIYDLLDWVARTPLTPAQRQIVVLYSQGWRLSEVSQDLGLSYSSVRRWFHQALPILGGTI